MENKILKKLDSAKSINYNVVEQFTSIQGEGHMQGTPMHFIRMGDCNRNCSFCDTKWDEWTEIPLSELVKDIKVEWVVITGGEPTMQDLRPLIKRLQAVGHKVAIETNGFNSKHWKGADWVCVSPKGIFVASPAGPGEVKLLVGLDDELVEQRIKDLYFSTNITLQPITKPDGTFIKANVDKAMELCLKYNVHYSGRLHHMIGVE